MEHLKIFESIPLYDGFYSSKVCILLITTPIGKSIGFYQNNNSKFYCGLYLISTDNLKTLDFSKFNTVVVEDLYDIIDTWKEGSITFNSSVATYLKGILVLGNKAHWEDNTLVAGEGGGYYYEPEFNGLRVWYNDGTVIDYDVSIIRSNTIQNKSKVVEAVIGNNIMGIGNSAFYGCNGLTSITIPNSVTSIGSNAFQDCSSLTSISIPNSVTSIGRYAFYNCSGLTSIDIPNSVTSIGNAAFENCSSLTHIYCDELQIQLDLSYLTLLLDGKSLNTIVDNWKEGASIVFSSENAINLKGKLVIGDRAHWDGDTLKYGKGGDGYYPYLQEDVYPWLKVWLRDNTILTYDDLTTLPKFGTEFKNNPVVKVTIGRNIDVVPDYCFSGCLELTEVIISNEGNSFSFGLCAFMSCGIEQITLPVRVTHIGAGSLYSEPSIPAITVIVKAVVPPSLDREAFNRVKRIYVPAESVNAYKTAWSTYADKIYLLL